MAGWLLKVGRPSGPPACGEEVGEGAALSGVVEGEGAGAGGVSEAEVGVAWGSGVEAGVIKGDAVGTGLAVKEGWASGVEVGAVTGDAVGAGEGVLAGWAGGAGGCCSHPPPAKLIMAMRTMRYLFMPRNTDASRRGIFKRR